MKVRNNGAPNLYEVESESETEKWYQVFADGTVIKCNCKGYVSRKTCKHLAAVQGNVWNITNEDTKVQIQAEALRTKIEQTAHALDLEVRASMFAP